MQEPVGYTLFATAIGRCALVFGERGVAGVYLPERTLAEARARIAERFPHVKQRAPDDVAADAIARIVALLSGERADLSTIPLDMRGVPAFHVKVYDLARTIPPGETLPYGEVAARVGSPGAARAVGQALGRNPFAIVVPCHRVLGAKGKIGGFTATGGVDTKRRMLSIEQAMAARAPAADHGFDYDLELAVRHLRDRDPAIARIIDDVGPCTLVRNRTQSVFLALAEAIVYQQLTGKAAATIFGRVKALFPRSPGGPTPRDVLRCPDTSLRAAGLSHAKTRALKDLATKTVAGELPTLEEIERMSDDAIVETLTRVRGVGRWTVEMLLIFRLGRPDVLPLDDFGVRKGFGIMTGARDMPTKKDLEAYGARWAPYRSVASFYAWRAVDRARAVASA